MSDTAIEALRYSEFPNSSDCISRQAAIDAIDSVLVEDESCKVWFKLAVKNLPSAQPYTDEEIQKIQDLEQAQLDKIRELAYQEGKADAMAEIIRCKECENWHMYRNRGEGWCDQWKDMLMDICFCSSANRREDDK